MQDPDDAQSPSMPTSALRHVEVDHKTTLDALPSLLVSLAGTPAQAPRPPTPKVLLNEHALFMNQGDPLEHLKAIGQPSTFTCPECHGSLWEIAGSKPPQYRCHTGHGFSLGNLAHAQGVSTDSALWSAVRALQEKRFLLDRAADAKRDNGDHAQAEQLSAQAREVAEHASLLRGLVKQPLPSG